MMEYTFRLDDAPLVAAITEVERLLVGLDEAHPNRADAAALFGLIEQCFVLIPDVHVTEGARESVTRFEPSQRLLELLAALRASNRDREFVAQCHEASPC
jgi:hypothetical protein